MKKMKLFYGILIGLVIFSSCNNNDDSTNNDNSENIIIGKWKIYKQFESDTEIQVDPCDAFWIIEYNADKRINSFNYDPDNYPVSCGLTVSEFGWNWISRGNGNYEIRYMEEEGTLYYFYKQGERLIREYPNGTTKIIYDPYN